MVLVANVLCIGGFFLSVVDFFLSFTSGHMYITPVCSVVDVLCAVSYTVAEDE